MGDTSDGSSTAAQSAPQTDIVHPGAIMSDADAKNADTAGSANGTPGLFSRLTSMFAGQPGGVAQVQPDRIAPGGTMLGMGNLRRMRVQDVAIPRIEITAVPVDIEFEALVEVFRDSGNTRLPVYEGTLDTPLGMIHLKDFALRHGFNGDTRDAFQLRGLMRPLLFAPPSMPIGVLLQKMQTDRSHMALVIDEYGGVDGLVTIEDLIEQVIGEIEDEHDVDEEALWSEEKPGCFAAAARTPVDEFQNALGIRLVEDQADEEIDTLGGLVFMAAGRVPARGEVIPHASGVQFEVIDADPRRIKRLRVRLPGVSAGPVRSTDKPAAAAE